MTSDAQWLAEQVILPALNKLDEKIDNLHTAVDAKDENIRTEVKEVRDTSNTNKRDIGAIKGYLKGKKNGLTEVPESRGVRAKRVVVENAPKMTGYTILMGIVYVVFEYMKNGGI